MLSKYSVLYQTWPLPHASIDDSCLNQITIIANWWFSIIFLRFVYLRESVHGCMQGGGAERERGRVFSRLCAECGAKRGLSPTALRS